MRGRMHPRARLSALTLCVFATALAAVLSPGVSGGYASRAPTPQVSQGSDSPLATAELAPDNQSLYPVVISETGLPSGTIWSLYFNGSSNFTSKASMSYEVANGTYPYAAGPAFGGGAAYEATSPTGSVHVTGAPKSRTLDFQLVPTPPRWKVTFAESGLPVGTAWWATLNGTTSFSTSASLAIPIANGSFEFGIPTAGTFVPNPGSGSVTVKGVNLTISIRFVSPTVLGLPPAEGFAVVSIGLTLGLLFLGILIILVRRRDRRSRDEASASSYAIQPPIPPADGVAGAAAAPPDTSPPATPTSAGPPSAPPPA